jgi:hypothetical protein
MGILSHEWFSRISEGPKNPTELNEQSWKIENVKDINHKNAITIVIYLIHISCQLPWSFLYWPNPWLDWNETAKKLKRAIFHNTFNWIDFLSNIWWVTLSALDIKKVVNLWNKFNYNFSLCCLHYNIYFFDFSLFNFYNVFLNNLFQSNLNNLCIEFGWKS